MFFIQIINANSISKSTPLTHQEYYSNKTTKKYVQRGRGQMDSMFLKGLTGEVVTPKDSIYEEARQEWNRAIDKFPLVIVYCEKKQDVVNAIH